jgi:hypothetical protein
MVALQIGTSPMPDEQSSAEPSQDTRLATMSDEWLARWLGDDLQVAMLRLFGAVIIFLVVCATAAYWASR